MLASLSRVACLLLSKQSGVTTRTNCSLHALVFTSQGWVIFKGLHYYSMFSAKSV